MENRKTVKNQLARIGKNSFIYGLGSIINRFIGLLLLPLFTSYLTPTDYGILSLLNLLLFFLQPIFSLGISSGLGPVYYSEDSSSEKNYVIWTSFFLLIISILLLIVTSWFTKRIISNLLFKTSDYSLLVFYYIIGISFEVLSTSFRLKLQYEEKAIHFSILTVGSVLLSVVLRVVFVVFLGYGVEGFVLSHVITQGLSFFSFMVVSLDKYKIRIRKRHTFTILKLSLPLIPSSAFVFVLMQSNRYILQYFYDLDVVGLYSIGFNFGMVLGVVVNAFTTAWFPFFMSFINKQSEAHELFNKIALIYLYVFGFFTSLFFFFAYPVTALMTQQEFIESYKIIGLVALSQLILGYFSFTVVGIYYKKDLRIVPFLQLIASVISLIVNVVCIYYWNLFGAGIGLVLGQLILIFTVMIWNKKNKNIYFTIKVDKLKIIKFFLILFLCVMVLIVLNPKSALKSWALGIILTITALINLLSSIDNSSKKEIIKMIRSRSFKV